MVRLWQSCGLAWKLVVLSLAERITMDGSKVKLRSRQLCWRARKLTQTRAAGVS